jgi:hypothetical protein
MRLMIALILTTGCRGHTVVRTGAFAPPLKSAVLKSMRDRSDAVVARDRAVADAHDEAAEPPRSRPNQIRTSARLRAWVAACLLKRYACKTVALINASAFSPALSRRKTGFESR